MEIWDLYDHNRQPLNITHQRGKKIKSGQYHIVVEVWTINSRNEVLLTLRDESKKAYPGKWENTGGSVLAGETSIQGAVRELREETGIACNDSELVLLGTLCEKSAFFDIYLLHRDIPVYELKMQKGETTAARWVTLNQLDAMIADQTLAIPIGISFNKLRKEFNNHLSK